MYNKLRISTNNLIKNMYSMVNNNNTVIIIIIIISHTFSPSENMSFCANLTNLLQSGSCLNLSVMY